MAITDLSYIISVCDIHGFTKYYNISNKAIRALDETCSIETYSDGRFRYTFACETCMQEKNVVVKKVIANTIAGREIINDK